MQRKSNSIDSYNEVKRGWYNINGKKIFFRSKWEANYAVYLDFLIAHGEIKKWEFEPKTFIFKAIELGTRSYCPDFRVTLNNGSKVYHEVKGYMDAKSKTKIKRFRKYFPEENLIVIDADQYKSIKKWFKLLKFF